MNAFVCLVNSVRIPIALELKRLVEELHRNQETDMSPNVLIDRRNISVASRIVFTIAPYTLVRIGPKLDVALDALLADLVAALHDVGKAARHLTTTYSLANIALVFDCSEKEEGVGTHIQRLRLVGGKITGYAFEDKKLSHRIAEQLQSISIVRPSLSKPFMCVESWRGPGSQHHPIYARMVEASTSVEAWKEFKAMVRTSTLVRSLILILRITSSRLVVRSLTHPNDP